MTLAHLSDTHIGFRAFQATTASGVNQREQDVLRTFRDTLSAIAERDPDLVIHAGDFFHQVRPSNFSVIHAFRTLDEFQRQRGKRPFLIIGGNHDTPKASDAGNILGLFEHIEGVTIVPTSVQRIDLPDLDAEILAIPSNSAASRDTDIQPSPNRTHSIVVCHGMVSETLLPQPDLSINDLNPQNFAYVALGDFHVFKEFGPRACYSGSTDFTSTDIWAEIRTPKCWVYFDTSIGVLQQVPISTRSVLDLPVIDAREMLADAVIAAMEANANWSADSRPVVRQRVSNLDLATLAKLNPARFSSLRSRALYYELDRRSAAPVTITVTPAPRLTLEDQWVQYVEQRNLSAELPKPEVKARGLELLNEALVGEPV